MKSDTDPYVCLNCGHRGQHRHIMLLSTCHNCNSLLIAPLYAVAHFDWFFAAPAIRTQLPQLQLTRPVRRHLRIVSNEPPAVTKNGTPAAKGGSNET